MKKFNALLCLAVSMFAFLSLLGCEGKIERVKNSTWEGDKSLTIGSALDNFKYFETKTWELKKTDNGRELVQFTGTLKPDLFLENSQKDIDELKEKYNSVKKLSERVDYYNQKLEQKDKDAYLFFYGRCWDGHKEEKACIDNEKMGAYGRDNFYDFAGTRNYSGYKVNAEALVVLPRNLKRYSDLLAETDRLIEEIKQKKVNIIYQFIINKDDTIKIENGYGVRADGVNGEAGFYPTSALKEIYQNKANVIEESCFRLYKK